MRRGKLQHPVARLRLLMAATVIGCLAIDGWSSAEAQPGGGLEATHAATLAATASENIHGNRSGREICATDYHARLQRIEPRFAGALKAAFEAVKAEEPDWPGKWLSWDPRKVAQRIKLKRVGYNAGVFVVGDRVCRDSMLGPGGRIRCLKWEPKPEGFKPPPPPAADPAEPQLPDLAERRRLRTIAGFVARRGVLPLLAHNEPFDHLTRRSRDELLGYLRQPPSTALCTGADAMLGFYTEQLAPYHAVSVAARSVAAEAWTAAVSAANVKAGETAAAPPIGNAKALRQMIMLTAHRLTPGRDLTAIEKQATPLGMIEAAHASVETPAEGAHVATDVPADRAAALRALRLLESAYYAHRRAEKFSALDRTLHGLMGAIRTAHGSACTCKD